LGGLAASWAMSAFQKQWAARVGAPPSNGAPATHKAADRISVAMRGKKVAPKDKEAAGEAVHYATGAAMGAGYGLLNEITPRVSKGFGTGFGTITTAIVDQFLVPRLGLAKGFKSYSPKAHAYGYASHLVFGLALEATRRLLGGRRA
jgi:hypothetical protein